jgi:hypothetical protein
LSKRKVFHLIPFLSSLCPSFVRFSAENPFSDNHDKLWNFLGFNYTFAVSSVNLDNNSLSKFSFLKNSISLKVERTPITSWDHANTAITKKKFRIIKKSCNKLLFFCFKFCKMMCDAHASVLLHRKNLDRKKWKKTLTCIRCGSKKM